MSELGDNTPEDERPYFEPAGAGQEENGVTFAGHEALRVYEPALLDTLRQRFDDGRICRVHVLDSSSLYGTVTLVSDDGRVAVIEDGRDAYTIDTSLVAVVQTSTTPGKPPQDN